MAIRNWLNGQQGVLTGPALWKGGKAPTGTDTAVIGSKGDGAPQPSTVDGLGGFVYGIQAGQSGVELFTGTFIQSEFHLVTIDNGAGGFLEYAAPLPVGSQVPPGLTIAGLTLDLLGQGSLATAVLQQTTLTATSTVNVVGSALLLGYYDNTLGGTINVGEPTTLSGKTVKPPAANSHGATSELDISLSGDGSWNGSSGLSGYVPTMTNAGTIRIGAGSSVRLELAGHAYSTVMNGAIDFAIVPSRSTFINTGTIAVDAGGQLLALGSNGTLGTIDTSGSYTTFVNNGLIQVNGAAGQTSISELALGGLVGTGTISLNGGTQADPTKTGLLVANGVVNTHFAVHDGLLEFDANYSYTGPALVPHFGPQFFGGGVTLEGNADLLLNQGTLFPAQSLAGVFATPITGFASGDTIGIVVSHGMLTNKASFSTVWDQAHNQLTVDELSTDISGQHTLFPAAILTLEGTYKASDFHLAAASATVAGNALFELTLTTTHA